jgi:putative hydrolase of the HAD superfamily
MTRELPAIKLIAFDLDDTLYPEIEFVKSGFKAVASEVNKRCRLNNDFYTILWDLFQNGERRQTFNKALHIAGCCEDARLVEELIQIYRNHKPAIRLYPDADEILHLLKGKVKIGLISDGHMITQKNKVEALNINHFFNLCIFTDEAGKEAWKPSPWGYQAMMDYFSLSGKDCAYVGDNGSKDFIGATLLGWETFKIKRAEGIYREIHVEQGYDATHIIENLTELTNYIGNIIDTRYK